MYQSSTIFDYCNLYMTWSALSDNRAMLNLPKTCILVPLSQDVTSKPFIFAFGSLSEGLGLSSQKQFFVVSRIFWIPSYVIW